MKQCVTHHFACDCREQKFKELKRENAALRADKKRLDWLDEHCEVVVLTNCDGSDLFIHNAFLNPDKAGKLRSIIDAYRKEAKP